MKDYYQILGVSRNASDAEIKKAYRQMARKYHPDVAGAGADTEEKFKEVQNAFAVLGDQENKSMYDRGVDPLSSQSGGNPFGGGFGFDFGGMNDIFDMFTGGFSGAYSSARQGPRSNVGQDLLKSITISLEEAIFGTHKKIAINLAVRCSFCEGSGSNSKSSPTTCATCSGVGIVQTVQRTMFGQIAQQVRCPDCQGTGQSVADPCAHCSGNGILMSRETVEVDIPLGVKHGDRVRFPQKGNAGPNGGENGDLYLEIHVKKDDVFEVSNHDLVAKLQVHATTAMLGKTVEIQTFDGKQMVEIPQGISSGQSISITGLGLPKGVRSELRGDVKIFIEVIMPSKLDKKQQKLVQELAKSLNDDKQKFRLANLEDGGFLNWIKRHF
jgi:molecular chaperone DnaJ